MPTELQIRTRTSLTLLQLASHQWNHILGDLDIDRRRYKRPPDFAVSPQLSLLQQQQLISNHTMQFFKPTLVLVLTLVTYASASALPQSGECTSLGYACSPGLDLQCCSGLTCAPPGVVSSPLIRILKSILILRRWQCVPIL